MTQEDTFKTLQHKIGSGFDHRSTTEDVLSNIDLTGQLAIVTGGYSGLGLETTRALVQAGAHVVVTARRQLLPKKLYPDCPVWKLTNWISRISQVFVPLPSGLWRVIATSTC